VVTLIEELFVGRDCGHLVGVMASTGHAKGELTDLFDSEGGGMLFLLVDVTGKLANQILIRRSSQVDSIVEDLSIQMTGAQH